jgi:hypothetical protein
MEIAVLKVMLMPPNFVSGDFWMLLSTVRIMGMVAVLRGLSFPL